MTTIFRHIVMAREPFYCALFVFVVLAITRFGETSGNGINNVNDVNEILRDATTAETDTFGVDVGNGQMLRNSETKHYKQQQKLQQQFKNKLDLELNRINDVSDVDMNDENNVDDNIDSDVDVDSDEANETSVELLRFVNDDEKHNERQKVASATITTAKAAKAASETTIKKSHFKINKDFNSGDSSADSVNAADDADGMNNNSNNNNNDNDNTLTLQDQVRLLTKQLNALMTRRREDYEMLERNLRKSLRMTTNAESVDSNMRSELEQLRLEMKSLRENSQTARNNNKERLTIEWLQQSVTEVRKQLSELQQMANNAAKDMAQRKESYEDLATIRNDFQQLKLELIAIKERQGKTEVYVHELRDEILQQEEDTKRMLHTFERKQQENAETLGNENENENENESTESELTTEPSADHKRRHCRFQRQQIHELQLSQRRLKHQIDELKFHRIGERVRNIEIEQHRIADANFNLSRQIASLDKLHSSMLELLEDVEGLQNKMDKNLPELRHEISKLEFSNAQLNSEQNLVREEGKNVARSVQAMAVSISTLLDERENAKRMQNNVAQLQTNVDRLGGVLQDVQHALNHRHKVENKMQRTENEKANHLKHTPQQQHRVRYHHHQQHNHIDNNNNNDEHKNNNQQTVAEQHVNRNGKSLKKADTTNVGDDVINSDAVTETETETETNGNGNGMQNHFDYTPMSQRAESLVAKLENVEQQYESIIEKLPQDCSEVSNVGSGNGDGLYLIAPAGEHRPLMAHCTADGWTTIQRRYDGSADFNRSWVDYANGFGAPIGEYWIGNEQLHHLTLSNCTSLRVIMQDIYDNTWLAEYDYFYISSRDDGYRLHVGGYHGNASDALDYQQGMQFSAIDVDRDISQTHCAANYEGGWWFSHCQHANLNGRYNLGLTWFDASRNEWIAVKSSQMLIKRHQTTSSVSCSSNLKTSSVTTKATSATTTILSNKASVMQKNTQTTSPILTTGAKMSV